MEELVVLEAIAVGLGLEQQGQDVVSPVTVANGTVAIVLSLLMSVIRVGGRAADAHANDVTAVFEAALRPS